MAKSKKVVERGRLSSRKKGDDLLRAAPAAQLHLVSRELGLTAARLSKWRDQFLAGGHARLKNRSDYERDAEETFSPQTRPLAWMFTCAEMGLTGGAMTRKRHTEKHIIAVLKDAHAGIGIPELCRKHGISNATFYKWRTKYAGLEVSDVKKLRQLEDENRRLKQMMAEQALDIQAL